MPRFVPAAIAASVLAACAGTFAYFDPIKAHPQGTRQRLALRDGTCGPRPVALQAAKSHRHLGRPCHRAGPDGRRERAHRPAVFGAHFAGFLRRPEARGASSAGARRTAAHRRDGHIARPLRPPRRRERAGPGGAGRRRAALFRRPGAQALVRGARHPRRGGSSTGGSAPGSRDWTSTSFRCSTGPSAACGMPTSDCGAAGYCAIRNSRSSSRATPATRGISPTSASASAALTSPPSRSAPTRRAGSCRSCTSIRGRGGGYPPRPQGAPVARHPLGHARQSHRRGPRRAAEEARRSPRRGWTGGRRFLRAEARRDETPRQTPLEAPGGLRAALTVRVE